MNWRLGGGLVEANAHVPAMPSAERRSCTGRGRMVDGQLEVALVGLQRGTQLHRGRG
jgi:hypothetical protein